MNAILTREVVVPGPREFGIVWEAFFVVVSAIAKYRGDTFGPRRFGELSVHAATLLRNAAGSEEMNALIENMANDNRERIPLGILYEEMQYIAWRYREVPASVGMEDLDILHAMEAPEQFADEDGDPDDPGVVGDIENVAGSIKSILDKLPGWIRKAIDAILEALKLTRGVY